MHRLAPVTQEFSKNFKLAYFSGFDPSANVVTNLASLFLITAPKVQIAIDNYNRYPLLRSVAQIKMPTLPIPKVAPSYFIVFFTCAALGASRTSWGNERISQCLDGIEKLADAVSVVVAVGLISTGQVFAGGVILFCVSIQVLQRLDYISPNKSLGMSFLGNMAGLLVAPTHAQRVIKVSLIASLLLGIWLCNWFTAHENHINQICISTYEYKYLRNLYFFSTMRNVIQGARHPDAMKSYNIYNECLAHLTPKKAEHKTSTLREVSEKQYVDPTLEAFRRIRSRAQTALGESDHNTAFSEAKKAWEFFQKNRMIDKTELHPVANILGKCAEYGVRDGTWNTVIEYIQKK